MPRSLAWFLAAPVLALSASAGAAGVTVHIGVPPPPPRVEVVGVAPSPAHFWVAGHYRWDGHRHVWVNGRWMASRSGHVWVRDHWAERNGQWTYYAGHWVKSAPVPGAVSVVVPTAPPPLQVEVIPAAPGRDFFWVGGHWRWEGGRHVWDAGRWEPRRAEEVYSPAHWVHDHKSWRYVGGGWHRVG